MPKHTINHDRPNCIGCSVCEALSPERWEMVEDPDGELKADCKNTDVSEEQFDKEMEVAESCPVNVIHLVDENGKQLI